MLVGSRALVLCGGVMVFGGIALQGDCQSGMSKHLIFWVYFEVSEVETLVLWAMRRQ